MCKMELAIRSEEHTSELQSHVNIVCRLLLEKKNKEWLIQNLFIAMTKPDFVSFQFMCDYLNICVGEIPIKFQSNKVGSQFSYEFVMSLIGGLILAFPFVFYQMWGFVKPGLKANEKSAVSGITFFVTILFLICFFFLMIRRPPRSTLFPTRRSSD